MQAEPKLLGDKVGDNSARRRLAFGRCHEWAGNSSSGNELRCGIGGIFLARFLRPTTLITPHVVA
jgi:hypothetical protein